MTIDDAIGIFSDMLHLYDDIKQHIDIPDMELPVAPDMPTFKVDQSIGIKVRNFLANVNKWIANINANKTIQSETRGLSGTKNEMLRDHVVRLNSLQRQLIDVFSTGIDEIITTKFSDEEVTQKEANKIVLSGDIVSFGEVDKVSLFKLRKFTKSKPDANYYEYIRRQRALLFNIPEPQCLTVPLDRYGLVPKSSKPIDEIWPGNKSYDDLRVLLDPVKYDKNVIIIYRQGPGYIFGTIDPRPDDVTKPINQDFIKRTRVVTQINALDSETPAKNILCLPKKGSLVSLYETYDYVNFQFITQGLHQNLVPYYQAIGYYTCMTGDEHDDCPLVSHIGYNDLVNEIFSENYYRHDLTLLATEFKFGQGLSDTIKNRLKELLIEQAESYKTIDVPATIRQSINDVLPKDISRESSISSYLGIVRLIDEFTKEYRLAIRDVNWESHQKITMVDVYNRCVARCDKLGAWSIDFKSPKDLFWK